MTWLVEVGVGVQREVVGTLRIEAGTLIFYDAAGRISLSFAPGTWRTVELEST